MALPLTNCAALRTCLNLAKPVSTSMDVRSQSEASILSSRWKNLVGIQRLSLLTNTMGTTTTAPSNVRDELLGHSSRPCPAGHPPLTKHALGAGPPEEPLDFTHSLWVSFGRVFGSGVLSGSERGWGPGLSPCQQCWGSSGFVFPYPGPPFQRPEAADFGKERGVNTVCTLCHSTVSTSSPERFVLPAISSRG